MAIDWGDAARNYSFTLENIKSIANNENMGTGTKLDFWGNALNSKLGGSVRGEGFGKFGGFGAIAGDAISGIGSIIGNKYGEDFDQTQKATQSTIRKGLEMIPGYGQLIAAATGIVDAIGTATGTNLSNLDKNSAERAGVSGAAKFNNVMNSIPGNSMLWGIFAGDRTDNFKMSNESEEMSSGYAGTVGDMRAAQELGNKRVLFGKNRINDYIDQARKNDEILSQINLTNTMRKQSDYYQDLIHQNANRYAGQSYLQTRVGKTGMKLMSVEEARNILSKKQDTLKLQNGGVVGIEQSILPDGALHKELNHMDDVNPDLAEEITRKGIPVVTVDENGEYQQVAEIEREELLLTKSLTDEIERLRKIGTDEAMIECGKLVAAEIIENTQDNTGMITEEVENGK